MKRTKKEARKDLADGGYVIMSDICDMIPGQEEIRREIEGGRVYVGTYSSLQEAALRLCGEEGLA